MKHILWIALFAIVGCGTEMPKDLSAENLSEASYDYPEQSFDPDAGQWSSSDYGSGGGSGSGYGDMDAGFDCSITPCLYGMCDDSNGSGICACEEGYGGERCDSCAAGYAAIGCDDCPSDFECVLAESL